MWRSKGDDRGCEVASVKVVAINAIFHITHVSKSRQTHTIMQSHQPCKVGIIIPILQTKKLRENLVSCKPAKFESRQSLVSDRTVSLI